MSEGPFLDHVQARQALMRTVLMLAAQERGGEELVSWSQLDLDAAALAEATHAKDEAIKAQDERGRHIEVVHVGDTDAGTGGDHIGG